MYHNNVTNLIHFHFHNHFIVLFCLLCYQKLLVLCLLKLKTPKTASAEPPEDGRLTPATCRGLRHKVIVKVEVY
jgi:hypothetical protein